MRPRGQRRSGPTCLRHCGARAAVQTVTEHLAPALHVTHTTLPRGQTPTGLAQGSREARAARRAACTAVPSVSTPRPGHREPSASFTPVGFSAVPRGEGAGPLQNRPPSPAREPTRQDADGLTALLGSKQDNGRLGDRPPASEQACSRGALQWPPRPFTLRAGGPAGLAPGSS